MFFDALHTRPTGIMHLINVNTLKLEEFTEGSIPQYAILSHRWTKEELTFKEISKDRPNRSKKGYQKLTKACEVAATYQVEYVWIDTCCIDKRSSAELSEAINSMFAWYANAKVCLAYLEDVKIPRTIRHGVRQTLWEGHIGLSVWFTRSFTLQELVAPRLVDFYDGDWMLIADKRSNAYWVARVTGVDKDVLLKKRKLSECSIADRMSWAAKRTATRTEDISYSLLGIFDVNMALLYGEGVKAFRRLQEEIIRRTEDTTFLVWGHQAQYDTTRSLRAPFHLLASSPKDFLKEGSGEIASERTSPRRIFAITNIGLEMEMEIMRWSLKTYGLVIARTGSRIFVLVIRKISSSNIYYRVALLRDDIDSLRGAIVKDTLKIVILWEHNLQHGDSGSIDAEESYGFYIEPRTRFPISAINTQNDERSGHPTHDKMVSATPEDRASLKINFLHPMRSSLARLTCTVDPSSVLVIFLSFDFESCPWALICDERDEPDILTIQHRFMTLHSHHSDEEGIQTISTRQKFLKKHLYALRGASESRSSVSGRIPAQLFASSAVNVNILITFMPPHSYQNSSTYWVFRISEPDERPMPDMNVRGSGLYELSGGSAE